MSANAKDKLKRHIQGCDQCQTGTLCDKGKTLMFAAMEAPSGAANDPDGDGDVDAPGGIIATARAAFARSEGLVLSAPNGSDEFDIQWMPPGPQAITCFVKNKPREMQFDVQARHASAFNAMLQQLRAKAAAGEWDEPFIDFNHEDGAAAGRPTEMYWGGQDEKRGGIRLKGKWTGSGKAAVVNRDFTRFSPQWDFNKETDEPTGIGVNLGGLVNRAAFKQIQAVAKGAAQHKGKTMDEKAFKELLDAALKPLLERVSKTEEAIAKAAGSAATAQAADADKKIILLVQEANKPLLDKIAAFETAQQSAQTAAAKEAVMKHVARGAIGPADTDTIAFYAAAYAKDASGTEKVLAKLPGRAIARITSSSGGTVTVTGGEPEEQFIAKAKAFGEANKITDQAQALTAYGRTVEGRELYEQFRNKIVAK